MAEELIVTKIAEQGKKFDETGQCITSHERSIVFLPREAKPGELVRVRLIPITDPEGNEKKDRNGRVMYRAVWAPASLSLKQRIAQEAQRLRACAALQGKAGEAAARTLLGAAPQGGTGFDWYYFEESAAYASRFSPSALLLLEHIEHVQGSAEAELLAWVADGAYYRRRARGEPVDYWQCPDLSAARLEALGNDSLLLSRRLDGEES